MSESSSNSATIDGEERAAGDGAAVAVAPPPPDEELYCPNCGYDVRALTGKGCPECGEKINLDDLRKSQIPWSYRHDLGRLRAYWRTAWLVTFRTKRFCREAVRPVDLKDALRFRLWTILVVYTAIALLAAWLAVANAEACNYVIEALGVPVALVMSAVCLAAIWLFLYALTGIHTYWFHPRALPVARQNRVLALSYYACGPLVLLAMAILIVPLGALMSLAAEEFGAGIRAAERIQVLAILLAVSSFVLAMAGYWLCCIRMLAAAAGRGAVGVIAFVIVLPVLWLLLAGLILLGVPLLVAYTWAGVVSIVG